MTATLSKHEKNLAAIIHASTFSRFIFPFGNFILLLVLWSANKKDIAFVDENGKQVLNFQISLLLYSIIVGMVSIPFFIGLFPDVLNLGHFGFDRLNTFNNWNLNFDTDNFNLGKWWLPLGISGLAQGTLFMVNLVYTILGVVRTHEGQAFHYPLTIKFIK